MGKTKMEKQVLNKKEGLYEVKVIKGRYYNLHLLDPQSGSRVKVRMAGEMIFLSPLVHFVVTNGESYYKNYADPRGGSWQDEVFVINMSKQQILGLIDRPRKKARSYERLLQFLGVTESS